MKHVLYGCGLSQSPPRTWLRYSPLRRHFHLCWRAFPVGLWQRGTVPAQNCRRRDLEEHTVEIKPEWGYIPTQTVGGQSRNNISRTKSLWIKVTVGWMNGMNKIIKDRILLFKLRWVSSWILKGEEKKTPKLQGYSDHDARINWSEG